MLNDGGKPGQTENQERSTATKEGSKLQATFEFESVFSPRISETEGKTECYGVCKQVAFHK